MHHFVIKIFNLLKIEYFLYYPTKINNVISLTY